VTIDYLTAPLGKRRVSRTFSEEVTDSSNTCLSKGAHRISGIPCEPMTQTERLASAQLAPIIDRRAARRVHILVRDGKHCANIYALDQ